MRELDDKITVLYTETLMGSERVDSYRKKWVHGLQLVKDWTPVFGKTSLSFTPSPISFSEELHPFFFSTSSLNFCFSQVYKTLIY